MKARTELQRRVVSANERIRPLSKKAAEWAFRQCVPHYALRSGSGQAVCMDCGKQWKTKGWKPRRCPDCGERLEINGNGQTICTGCGKQWKTRGRKTCRCPGCGARLAIWENSRKRHYRRTETFSVLNVQDGLQVLRVFVLTADFNRHFKAVYDIQEIIRYWMDENGRTEITRLQIKPTTSWYYNYYRDCEHYANAFYYDSRIELRKNSPECDKVCRWLADCRVCPGHKVIPILKRNGLKGTLGGIGPMTLLPALLTDSRAETMFKAGRKADLYFFLNEPRLFDKYWNTYKIVIRNNYVIPDFPMWADYLLMLDRLGKDIRNAHYVCPPDLSTAHDLRQRQIEALDEKKRHETLKEKAAEYEDYFRKLKNRFFGLSFTDGLIKVRTIESVADYYIEGDILHHCVGDCRYFLKPESLVLSARIGNQRIETVEVSLKTFKVLQSRGFCNKSTEYHDRIVRLVQDHAPEIQRRMLPQTVHIKNHRHTERYT